jgi:hypothetical protein
VWIRHRRAGRACAPGAVLEAEVEHGDGGRDRHDRERHSAHPQCRDCGYEAEHHRGRDARERRQWKADPRVDREMRDGEAGDARERELHDRDLSDEAGDHDE